MIPQSDSGLPVGLRPKVSIGMHLGRRQEGDVEAGTEAGGLACKSAKATLSLETEM